MPALEHITAAACNDHRRSASARLSGAVRPPRLLAALLTAALALPARAQAPDAQAYVSDQFRKVARKAFRQVVAAQLEAACPDDKPFCKPAVRPLADALDAALSGNDTPLKQALDEFFLASSSAALLTASLDPSAVPELAGPIAEVAACLGATLAGRGERGACLLGTKALEALKPFVSAAAPAHLQRLQQAVASGSPVDAADVLHVLADAATHEKVQRPDLRILLLRLAAFASYGTEGGLFQPSLKFFLESGTEACDPTGTKRIVECDLLDYTPGTASWALWAPGADAARRASLAKCSDGRAARAFDAWVQKRDDTAAPYLAQLRLAFLRGERPDLGPLEALRLDGVTCDEPEAQKAVAELRRHARYLLAPLVVEAAVKDYGLPALAAAALLDYVRTNDKPAFERALRTVLVVGAAQAAGRKRSLDLLADEKPGEPLKVTSLNRPTTAKMLESCEARTVSALLGARPITLPEAKKCLSVATGAEVDVPALAQPPAGAPSPEWLQQHASQLEAAFKGLLAEQGASTTLGTPLGTLDARRLLRAADELVAGRPEVVRTLLTRAAVDLLASRLNGFVRDLVGKERDACLDDRRTVTLFDSAQAACTALFLIEGAYRPLADYYWAAQEGTAPTTSNLYRQLLAVHGLERSLFLFNVGLGVTLVAGDPGSTWGGTPYTALTVVDKVGLAVVKHHGPRSRFEAGVFAGGFLDAIVKTASGEGKDERFWLLGATVGWTRMGGVDVGVELHVAAAMPFELTAANRYGFATGLALVVPWSLVLDDEEE